jgi:hypothetical protein
MKVQKIFTISLALMRSRALLAAMVLAVSVACGGVPALFQDYEYEEELYLSLDGSATLYVNSSLVALNALRGASFDSDPAATIDKAVVSDFFNSAATAVTRVVFSRRHARRYVHVRIDVADVRRLSSAPPFNWSSYRFFRDGNLMIYRQIVGPPATRSADVAHWHGDEVIAFRLHLPSKVVYHNVDRIRRGNILVWEQTLAARLAGMPLELEARMETQSILYRTLWLFGAALLAVAVMFALVIWRVVKRSTRKPLSSAGRIDVG